jgi:hypothetical protein
MCDFHRAMNIPADWWARKDRKMLRRIAKRRLRHTLRCRISNYR